MVNVANITVKYDNQDKFTGKDSVIILKYFPRW